MALRVLSECPAVIRLRVCTVVVQNVHSFVSKAKNNLRNNGDFFIYRCLTCRAPHNAQTRAIRDISLSHVSGTTQRTDPSHTQQFTDRPEGTGSHACPQAIPNKVLRRIKRDNSHGRHRAAYTVDPVACLALHPCHTKCVTPYLL